MDYSKAKIYKIVNDVDDSVYIGSTCQALSKRMAEHRASMRSKRDSYLKLYQKLLEIGVEHFNIYLIKETPCENKEQLRAIEGQYIRELGTLNGHIAGRTAAQYQKEFKHRYEEKKKKYAVEHREEKKERSREHYTVNRETILEQQRQKYSEMTKTKIICDICGAVHNKKNTPNHLRSMKHQQALNN